MDDTAWDEFLVSHAAFSQRSPLSATGESGDIARDVNRKQSSFP